MTSAATTEIQMPSICQIMGKISTAPSWNTSVRRNEIMAEVRPALSAEKKLEVRMANPINSYDTEKIRIPRTVISISVSL